MYLLITYNLIFRYINLFLLFTYKLLVGKVLDDEKSITFPYN